MKQRWWWVALAGIAAADLWLLLGPAKCPACGERRGLADRVRGWHPCDWKREDN
jgi:hypothetical protein